MKKIILVICIMGFSLITSAQGNLQFNQVTRFINTGTVLAASTITIGSLIVPANKVWKIESGSITVNNQTNTELSLIVDDQLLFTSPQNLPFTSAPIWLAANTYSVQVSNKSGSPFTFKVAISAIEFNIIQ